MSTKAYGRQQRVRITFQRDFAQLKILMGLLVVVLSAAVAQSCNDDGSSVQRITQDSGGGTETEEEDPSPRVDPVAIPKLTVPQLSGAEIALRDKVAKEVCIDNEDIKKALEDLNCRVGEQLTWLEHKELYDRTPGRDSCYSLTHKFNEEYGGDDEKGGEWLEETCTKLAAYAFVQLNFLERKGIGDPVTEDELIEEFETIITDTSWAKLKRGGSSTHLKGLLRMNTYNLNERCSDSLRYDTHKGVVRDNEDFEIKQYIFAENALSKPVEKFIQRFRGYKEIKEGTKRIEGEKVVKTTATNIPTAIPTATTTIPSNATVTALNPSEFQDGDFYVSGTITAADADDSKATIAATTATTTTRKALVRNTSLIPEEKDFYFINWPKIRESFRGLPNEVKGEFDHLHFYRRNNDNERTTTVKSDLIHSIRVLKPGCGDVKDEQGNDSFAYLRADADFLGNVNLTSPEVNFFSRPRFGINHDTTSFKSRKNSSGRTNLCKLYAIGYESENSSETTDSGEDGEGIDDNFLCVANEVDERNILEGYLCYENMSETEATATATDDDAKKCYAAPNLSRRDHQLTGNIARKQHCMCAVPGSPETIRQMTRKSNNYEVDNSDSNNQNQPEKACDAYRGGAVAFKDIKLQGDSGDLKKPASTLMVYLRQEHPDTLAGEGDSQKGCIAGIDYIDLCGDVNFDDHPEINSLRSTYCSDTVLFQE